VISRGMWEEAIVGVGRVPAGAGSEPTRTSGGEPARTSGGEPARTDDFVV